MARLFFAVIWNSNIGLIIQDENQLPAQAESIMLNESYRS